MMKKAVGAFLVLASLTLAGGGAVYAALGDLVFERKGAPEGSASIKPSIFPHWVHRARFRCYVCHPKIFEMRQGANDVTMDKIKKGQFCGACHNGRIAFNVEFQTCDRCHTELPEE
jgi:c(7)-type cytochrome triheme protein